MHLRTFIIVFVISLASGHDRKIIAKLNPGCPDDQHCDSNTTLVYIKADSNRDSIHQIWDFTRGSPTIILAIAGINSTMNITWSNKKPSNFLMSEKPLYSFAASIDKLYEYDDINDNGHLSDKSPRRALPLEHTTWTLKHSVLTDNEAMVRLHGLYQDERRSGIIDIKLDLLPFKDYAEDLPHLIHTANSTLVDVSLVNFTTSRDYNASRYAIHFVLVSTDSKRESMNYTMRKSLDDEHTPGVFEIIEIKTPRSYKSSDGGFVQFRPVAYTEPERSVSSSTNAYISNFNRTSLPARSTLHAFYDLFVFDPEHLLVEDISMSFGLPGDGYYRQHNFMSWSFTIGYGAPPIESFSLFVVLIICLGLGVPVLLAASGIVCVVLRRYRQRNPPARFTDSE